MRGRQVDWRIQDVEFGAVAGVDGVRVVGTEAQLDQCTGVGCQLGLPSLVGLELDHGGLGVGIPLGARFAVQVVVDVANQGFWAFRDATQLIESLFLIVGFTLAGKPGMLMRLARLCAEACDVNLWMPVPAETPRMQILIRNVYEMSQFWNWGDLYQDTPAEMQRVLSTGERVAVRRRAGMLSVLFLPALGLGLLRRSASSPAL